MPVYYERTVTWWFFGTHRAVRGFWAYHFITLTEWLYPGYARLSGCEADGNRYAWSAFGFGFGTYHVVDQWHTWEVTPGAPMPLRSEGPCSTPVLR